MPRPRRPLLSAHKNQYLLTRNRGRKGEEGGRADAIGRFMREQRHRIFDKLFVSHPDSEYRAETHNQLVARKIVEAQKSWALGFQSAELSFEFRR